VILEAGLDASQRRFADEVPSMNDCRSGIGGVDSAVVTGGSLASVSSPGPEERPSSTRHSRHLGPPNVEFLTGPFSYDVENQWEGVLIAGELRRVIPSLTDSADLGARPLQTFRLVTFPMLSAAIIAGALLAFALSFDEVIVTTFTAGAQNTLPLWIFGAILRGQQLPEVNAVVVGVLVLTALRVACAAKIASGDSAEVLSRPTKS
jgi:hypothetical protein